MAKPGVTLSPRKADGDRWEWWNPDIAYNFVGTEGNDTLYGGRGDDATRGRRGDDRLHGGEGDDLLRGGGGDDRLYGGEGDDLLRGGGGDDRLYGGQGNDTLRGGRGDDYLRDMNGDNFLYGDRGDDYLIAGDGDDMLKGGRGDDVLQGGGGADRFVFDRNSGFDTIWDYEDGKDKIVFGGGIQFSDLIFTYAEQNNPDSSRAVTKIEDASGEWAVHFHNYVKEEELTESDFEFLG